MKIYEYQLIVVLQLSEFASSSLPIVYMDEVNPKCKSGSQRLFGPSLMLLASRVSVYKLFRLAGEREITSPSDRLQDNQTFAALLTCWGAKKPGWSALNDSSVQGSKCKFCSNKNSADFANQYMSRKG
jgi:hypothetical protein